ncbi:cbb3-type cytochrome oxidase subunit 3 [Bergeriella denitrificans]|uniref:Cb-type cytochrome c oxidase subunit IV n=1 Tax=Bergeriella denitrificans TaxID=494 RepID=A0A378UHI6_BERDE|nr:cbb3-type cytochrome c oxidase subunit 3 [Bergeriella denitrificans]STZ76786.1 Cb-type cytochrome c oxidase subunit IV [Bergeriella denitrificans]
MDVTWTRSLFTLCVFISFMLVLYIVFNKRNRQNYDDAANSIFDQEERKDKGGQ